MIDKKALEKAYNEHWRPYHYDPTRDDLTFMERAITAYMDTMKAKGWELKPIQKEDGRDERGR